MDDIFSQFIARKPRHQAADGTSTHVEILRADDKTPALIEVELLDLSRDGFQLRATRPLDDQEAVTLQLQSDQSESDVALPGVVRWCRPQQDGSWLVGCASPEPIDWETLGGLFLDGILSTDEPSR